MDRLDLLGRRVAQELPGVAQPQVVVLVGVGQLVVADVRVLTSRDALLGRDLKREVADLRDQFDVAEHRVAEDSDEPLLVLVVHRVGPHELAPEFVDFHAVRRVGEDVTLDHDAGAVAFTTPDSQLVRCHHLPFLESELVGLTPGW